MARTHASQVNHMISMMDRAYEHPGFSVVHVLSECVEFFDGAFDAAVPKKGGQFTLIDEKKHLHNFISETKLKYSDEDRLWIDKVRCVYWWWMNVYLENEASPLYAELVKLVEAMSSEEWLHPETERRMWDLDDALSSVVKARGITHYTIPFKDRPEIGILFVGTDRTLTREVLDPH